MCLILSHERKTHFTEEIQQRLKDMRQETRDKDVKRKAK